MPDGLTNILKKVPISRCHVYASVILINVKMNEM